MKKASWRSNCRLLKCCAKSLQRWEFPTTVTSSFTSASRFRGPKVDLKAAGSALGVQAVVTGKLYQEGESLSISIAVSDARTDDLIWGQQYRGKRSDILALQDEIAKGVVSHLGLRLSDADERAPLGIAGGIYLAEFGNGWFARIVRFIADTLTGVPSIIVGVFAYTIIVLPQKHFSTLSGGVALAVVMIPIVTRTTEEMIRLVPTSLREGALALGAPQWKVTLGVVLPAAASGIATGAMLAIARVSGETAPLLFTAFGSRFFNFHLDQPMSSLTVQIYNYAISPYDEWHAQAWAATLVLMTLILTINIIVRFFTRKKY